MNSTRAPARHPNGGPAREPVPAVRRRVLGLGIRLGALLALLGVLMLLRAEVATPVRVASDSMQPTYAAGNVVLVSQFAPELADLDRGDLVTFVSPEDGRRALKRVMGLPGDSLVIKDSVLYVNDRVVDEPYVDHALIDAYYSRTFEVPDGTVFLLGDNRGNSVDSRDYGPVRVGDLLGRVVVRLWPVVRLNEPEPSPPKF